MSEAPPFWFQKPGVAAWALWPLSAVYARVAAHRMSAEPKYVSSVPVLCIGNFIAGGAGKTPTAIAIAKMARDMNLRPGFLSRGYGGNVHQPTLVDIKSHNARDVGDEPLILGLYAATVVSPDRVAGAKLLEQQDVDIIIMDDGFQNPALHKDYSLMVVDAGRGIGNGYCLPAGPMRAGLRTQLAAASAVLLIGKSEAGTQIVRTGAKMAKPILSAEIEVRRRDDWENMPVLAYAGIADPTKFYKSLESTGAEIVAKKNFHDHHPYSNEECADLLSLATKNGLTLVTTEKDSVRLVRSGDLQQKLRAASKVLHVDLAFENPKMVELILKDTIRFAEENRLKRKRSA